jgi:hypothetical protein
MLGGISWTGTNGIQDAVKNSSRSIVKFWMPDTIPAINYESNYAETITRWDYFINTSFANWSVEKTDLGKDQSAVYSIYSYVFTPKKGYDRTVLLTMGQDGQEHDGDRIVYEFFRQALNYAGTGGLSAISHTRYVVCPAVNPWGYDNSSWTNSRGVLIKNNFPWNWDACIDDACINGLKGSSPLSEAETRIEKALIDFYMPIAYLNFHDTGETISSWSVFGFYPSSGLIPNKEPVLRTLEFLNNNGYNSTTGYSANIGSLDLPIAINYAVSIGIANSFVPEHNLNSYHLTSRWSSQYMTDGLRWFGNLILAFSQTDPK